MRKQILSGFMMFALVAGSLAPAGEARAEEFQIVDSDNPLFIMKRRTSLRLKLS